MAGDDTPATEEHPLPPPPAPPNSAAAVWAKDPYTKVVVVAQGVQPSPGAPSADKNNVLSIFVPADMTSLQMGASSPGPSPNVPAISGFRLSTSTHAHLTAQSPLTTVSLGAPGGEGMGGVAGLSLYTAGQKDERVDLQVAETYNNTFNKTVTGISTYLHKAELKITSGERTEVVNGDWGGTIHGSVDWKADKDMEFHAYANHIFNIEGIHKKQVVGLSNELLIGGEVKEILGAGKMETIVGAEVKMVAGIIMDVCAAHETKIEVSREGIRVNEDKLSAIKSDIEGLTTATNGLLTETLGLEQRTSGLEKMNIGAKLDQLEANIVTMDAQIVSLGIAVYK